MVFKGMGLKRSQENEYSKGKKVTRYLIMF